MDQVTHAQRAAIAVGNPPAQVGKIPVFSPTSREARIALAARVSARKVVVDMHTEGLDKTPAEADPAHGISPLIEARREGREAEQVRYHDQYRAADTGLRRQADVRREHTGMIVHSRDLHDRKGSLHDLRRQHLAAGDRAHPAVGQSCRSNTEHPSRHLDTAAGEVQIEHLVEIHITRQTAPPL